MVKRTWRYPAMQRFHRVQRSDTWWVIRELAGQRAHDRHAWGRPVRQNDHEMDKQTVNRMRNLVSRRPYFTKEGRAFLSFSLFPSFPFFLPYLPFFFPPFLSFCPCQKVAPMRPSRVCELFQHGRAWLALNTVDWSRCFISLLTAGAVKDGDIATKHKKLHK